MKEKKNVYATPETQEIIYLFLDIVKSGEF